MNRLVVVWLLALAVAPQASGDIEQIKCETAVPEGLKVFLKARQFEASGLYRQALESYEQALQLAPSVLEVRVAFAALLADLGRAERAAQLLRDQEGLDWYGRRTRALALSQLASRSETMLVPAANALREVLEERSDDANMQLALAQILQRTGDLAEAESLVAELRRKRISNPRMEAFHASLLEGLRREEEALEVYASCCEQGMAGSPCREGYISLLKRRGKTGEAGAIMLQWIDDRDPEQLMKAVDLLIQGRRDEHALRIVRRILTIQPSQQARRLEAILLIELDRWEEAAGVLASLLSEDPDDLSGMLQMAWVQARRGRLDAARDLVDGAWKKYKDDPQSAAASEICLTAGRIELAHGHPLVARAWLIQANLEQNGAEVVRYLAMSYRRTEDWPAGFAAMLRLQPRLSSEARTLAQAYEAEFRLRAGDAQGMRSLRPLLDSADLAEATTGLQVLRGLERWSAVVRETEVIRQRFPDDRNLRFGHAAALERLGRDEEAEQLFEALIAEDPSDSATANYLGYMWAERGQHLEQALEMISGAVEQQTDNPAYLDSLGWVHFKLGNLEQAEHWLRRAIEVGGADGTTLAHLGEVLLRFGQIEEARRFLQQALTLGCEHQDHIKDLLEGR